jgi:hypothetical protein
MHDETSRGGGGSGGGGDACGCGGGSSSGGQRNNASVQQAHVLPRLFGPVLLTELYCAVAHVVSLRSCMLFGLGRVAFQVRDLSNERSFLVGNGAGRVVPQNSNPAMALFLLGFVW